MNDIEFYTEDSKIRAIATLKNTKFSNTTGLPHYLKKPIGSDISSVVYISKRLSIAEMSAVMRVLKGNAEVLCE